MIVMKPPAQRRRESRRTESERGRMRQGVATKKPGRSRACSCADAGQAGMVRRAYAEARAPIREASRDTFREAVFLCTMPFWAARMSSGSAARRASVAALRSPLAIASSTLRTKVRMRLRRERLIAVRFAILRVIFLADVVLAMAVLVRMGRGARPEPAFRDGSVNETGKTAGGPPRGLVRAGL